MRIANSVRCVENMDLRCPIFCLFVQKFRVLVIFTENPAVSHQPWCTCQFKLFSKLCWISAPAAQIVWQFWNSELVKFQVFDYFVEKFLFYSYQFCFTCQLEQLTKTCTIWTSKAKFLGHFGPQSMLKFWTLVTFSKAFFGFTSVMLHMLIARAFSCVWNISLGPNFGVILGTKLSQNSGFWSFSQKNPLVLHLS